VNNGYKFFKISNKIRRIFSPRQEIPQIRSPVDAILFHSHKLSGITPAAMLTPVAAKKVICRKQAVPVLSNKNVSNIVVGKKKEKNFFSRKKQIEFFICVNKRYV
jgi:hypothetical protein